MHGTRIHALALALASLGALTASSLHAQSAQRFSVQASGLFVGTSGDAYEGMKAAAGGEVQLRYTPGLWSFGLGYQYSSHGVEVAEFSGEKVKLAGAFFEPRRTFDLGSSTFAPYASARLAALKESMDFTLEGQQLSASASGVQVNVGGGLLFRVSPRVNLDLGATVGLINFGELELTLPGGVVQLGSGGSGQNVVFRAGVAVGL